MKLRGWPRTIRFQLLVGLVLLEAFSMLLFGILLIRQQSRDTYSRAQQRLEHQAASVAAQAVEALKNGRPEMIRIVVRMMGEAPSVETAMVTDAQGKVLFASNDFALNHPLQFGELAQIGKIPTNKPYFFTLSSEDWNGVKAIYFQDKLYGYAWVKTEKSWDRDQRSAMVRPTAIFGVIWITASALLSWGLARSITRPLAVLQRGTKSLMQSPDGETQFPLPVTAQNEIGDLIEAFNRMVASIEEQRSGLSDTLSLLDSMLANAPIGLAFFDRRCRFVRVNRIFADITGIPLSRHLGRTLPEVLPEPVAHQLENTIEGVFEQDKPVRDLEVTGAGEFPDASADLDHKRISNSHHDEPGSLGGPDRYGRKRPQAQRRGSAQDGKACCKPAALQLLSRTRSTIHWKRSRIFSTCSAIMQNCRSRRVVMSRWRSMRSAASLRLRSRHCASTGSRRCQPELTSQSCLIPCLACTRAVEEPWHPGGKEI